MTTASVAVMAGDCPVARYSVTDGEYQRSLNSAPRTTKPEHVTDTATYWAPRSYMPIQKTIGDASELAATAKVGASAMNKLRDRFHTGMGVISVGCLLATSLGGALADRALHPVDTYRDIRKHRANPRLGPAQRSIRPTAPQCEKHDFHITQERHEHAKN
jgi:hypothetical protein